MLAAAAETKEKQLTFDDFFLSLLISLIYRTHTCLKSHFSGNFFNCLPAHYIISHNWSTHKKKFTYSLHATIAHMIANWSSLMNLLCKFRRGGKSLVSMRRETRAAATTDAIKVGAWSISTRTWRNVNILDICAIEGMRKISRSRQNCRFERMSIVCTHGATSHKRAAQRV